MPSSSPRRCRAKPASAGAAARDWAALPRDILSAVFLRLGPCLEIMRGAELACAAWRRAAVGDPGLWRRVDIDVGALASAGLRKGWGAMLRAAVDRGAGRCEAFSGPCDQELLLYLIERANSLKNLHLLCLDVPNEVLKVAVKKYPHLEDLELKYVSSPSDNMLISCDLTTEGLASILDNCPLLESLHITGSFKYYEMDDELQAKCTRVKNLTIPKYSIHG
ncbi:putative F-box/LRR-repeat protein 23 [Setaria italica]|uniref:putative F-box/LRR-repeat protein 23 n=1 Tax=Setaria italica TaxID=4555 RepID=UPI000350D597|nr:putative F-box/LRR-repeat protein 23 [Setaria italica]